MPSSLLYNTSPVTITLALFLLLLLFYRIGHGVQFFQKNKNADKVFKGLGPVEGALLGLLSFLLAFTFNMAADHYEKRKEVVVQEANNIGTVIYRADLYPDSVKQVFKTDMKEYIATRIAYYEAGDDENKIQPTLTLAGTLLDAIWKRAAYYSKTDASPTRSIQMIPAINAVMDSVNNREEARHVHVPAIILWLLLLLCLSASFVIGYQGAGTRADRLVAMLYSFMIAMTFYLILDLEKPRSGWINSDSSHQFMYELTKLGE